MDIMSTLIGLVQPAIDTIFRWQEGKDKMEISRQDFELRKKELEMEIKLRIAEEMRKPDSELRSFILDYEGKAADQTPFIKNLRASVRPIITYWSLIIITWMIVGGPGSNQIATRLNGIPQELWWIFLAIFGFWFGGRAAEHVADTLKKGDQEKIRIEGQNRKMEADARVREAEVRANAQVRTATPSAQPPLKPTPKSTDSMDDFWDDM